MEFKAKRGDLLATLYWTQSIVERRNTMPILANVLIEAQKGSIRITATDLEVGVRGEIEGAVAKEGTVNSVVQVSCISRDHRDRIDGEKKLSLRRRICKAVKLNRSIRSNAARRSKRLETSFAVATGSAGASKKESVAEAISASARVNCSR